MLRVNQQYADFLDLVNYQCYKDYSVTVDFCMMALACFEAGCYCVDPSIMRRSSPVLTVFDSNFTMTVIREKQHYLFTINKGSFPIVLRKTATTDPDDFMKVLEECLEF